MGGVVDRYKEFGYGIEQLTQSEAAHVYAAANVDAIRDRISQARFAAGFGLGETGTDASKTINNELTPVIAALQAENPNAILKTEKPTTPCRGRVVFATDTFIIQQVADDGGTGGQSPSINIATPKPRRATGRSFLALASMAAPAANLPASISLRQSRAGQPDVVSSPWRRWRRQRPISQLQYRHTKAAPGNRAALSRPGVDGDTGGQS